MTVVIITHNRVITEMADQVIEIKNGQVEHEYTNNPVKSVDDIQW